jgi:hypothetical protein
MKDDDLTERFQEVTMILTQPEAMNQAPTPISTTHIFRAGTPTWCVLFSDHSFWQLRSNARLWVALPASARGFESLLSSLVPAAVQFHLLANEG